MSPTRTKNIRMRTSTNTKFQSPLSHTPLKVEDSTPLNPGNSEMQGSIQTIHMEPQNEKTTQAAVQFCTSRLQAYLSLNGFNNLNELIGHMSQMLEFSLEQLNEHKGLIQTAQIKAQLSQKLAQDLQNETVSSIKKREEDIKQLKAKKYHLFYVGHWRRRTSCK